MHEEIQGSHDVGHQHDLCWRWSAFLADHSRLTHQRHLRQGEKYDGAAYVGWESLADVVELLEDYRAYVSVGPRTCPPPPGSLC